MNKRMMGVCLAAALLAAALPVLAQEPAEQPAAANPDPTVARIHFAPKTYEAFQHWLEGQAVQEIDVDRSKWFSALKARPPQQTPGGLVVEVPVGNVSPQMAEFLTKALVRQFENDCYDRAAYDARMEQLDREIAEVEGRSRELQQQLEGPELADLTQRVRDMDEALFGMNMDAAGLEARQHVLQEQAERIKAQAEEGRAALQQERELLEQQVALARQAAEDAKARAELSRAALQQEREGIQKRTGLAPDVAEDTQQLVELLVPEDSEAKMRVLELRRQLIHLNAEADERFRPMENQLREQMMQTEVELAQLTARRDMIEGRRAHLQELMERRRQPEDERHEIEARLDQLHHERERLERRRHSSEFPLEPPEIEWLE